jgi:hypothetical protein
MPLPELSTTVSVVKALTDLLGRLVDAPVKRRRMRFEEFFRPLHDQFQEVHVDYSAMLRSLERGLPFRDEDGYLTAPDSSGTISELEAAAIVDQKKKAFRAAREAREGVRDWLRNNAQAILGHVSEEPERRYLYALLVYFLSDDHTDFPDDSSLELRISSILRSGGLSAMNTPTSTLARQIRGYLDGNQVRDATLAAIHRLNQRCSDVVKAYVSLNAAVIQSTS